MRIEPFADTSYVVMEHDAPASIESDEDESDGSAFDLRHSLGVRAILIFGAAMVAFTLLASWTAGGLFQRQIERTIGPAFENLAYQIGDKLDRGIYERTRALQFTAGLALLRTPGTPAAQLRPVFDALLDASPDCVWVGFTDADGTVVCAAPRFFEGTNAAASPWFRGASHQSYVGDPHEFPELARETPPTGADSNPRFIDLAMPVTDSSGKFLGVLGAHLRWSWARDTQNTVVPETARREHLGVTIYAANGDVLLDSNATGWTDPPPAPPVGARAGLRGSLTEDTRGDTTYLTGYSRSRGFRTFRGQGWLVTVRQPAADAFAPVATLRRQILQFGAGLSVAVVTLVSFVVWRLSRRIRAIANAAARIGSGDVLALLPLAHGRDEFQKMCAALGAMVDKFRQREEKLTADNERLAARLHIREQEQKR